MIESNLTQFPHPHVDMISNFLELPHRPYSEIRYEKGDILTRLQFGKNEIHELSFLPMGSDPENIAKLHELIKKGINEDNNVMLIGYDTSIWNSNLGAHPVATMIDREEMEKRLMINGNKLVSVKTQRGELLTMDTPQVILLVYKKSRTGEFTGFEDDDTRRNIRLGGGFRMQIDGVKVEEGKVKLKLSGHFCYNDSHQRVLSLSSDDDKATPRSLGTYEVEYKDGLLYLTNPNQISVEYAVKSGKISDYSGKVVESILDQNREAVTKLFRMMLSVSPNIGMHQLEGMFNLQGDQIKIAIIDFDGIDNVDTLSHHLGQNTLPELSYKERLLAAQLSNTGFLLSDPIALRDIYVQQQNVEVIKQSVQHSDLSEEIKRSVQEHLNVPGNVFERGLTGPVKLGRLLKSLKVNYSQTQFPWLQTFKNGDDTIISIDADGFEIAYWQRKGDLIDTSNIHTYTQELSKITGRRIVDANIDYLQEGD